MNISIASLSSLHKVRKCILPSQSYILYLSIFIYLPSFDLSVNLFFWVYDYYGGNLSNMRISDILSLLYLLFNTTTFYLTHHANSIVGFINGEIVPLSLILNLYFKHESEYWQKPNLSPSSNLLPSHDNV